MTRLPSRCRTAVLIEFVLVVLLFALSAKTAAANTFAIVNNSGLAFGKFIAGSGGTVVISASTGIRSATGGVSLMNSTNQPAHFTVSCVVDGGPSSCDATSLYTVSSVADTTLTSGGNSMALTGITVYSVNKNSNSTGQLSGGTDTLKAGATLTVGNNQPPGSYAGSFSVTVAYP